MLVAAAAVVLVVAGIGALQLRKHASPAPSDTLAILPDSNARLLEVGLDHHIHCSIDVGFANRSFTEEEIMQTLGPDYNGLVTMVEQKIPGSYKIVVGHRCASNGRKFVHLILKSPQTTYSLLITRKNGEAFTQQNAAAIIQGSDIPIYDTRMKDLEVAGFETRDYLAFIVSDLGREDNIQMASKLGPVVRDFLTKLEA